MSTRPLERIQTAPLRPPVEFHLARPRRVRRASRRIRFRLRWRVRRREVAFMAIAVVVACLIAPALLSGNPSPRFEAPARPPEPRLLH